MYHLLAELIVAIHLLYIGIVIGGLALVVLGTVLRWQWIRNPWFRGLHLLMIAVVALEATFDYECPLTTWEGQLRTAAGEDPEAGRSFTSRLMSTVLHPEWASEEKLKIGSYAIALVILATFLLAPPRFRRARPIAAGERPRIPAEHDVPAPGRA